MKRGQGTFEYVLLLGGVLLIVVLAVVLLRGIGTGAGTDINKQSCLQMLVKARTCYSSDGSWNPLGTTTFTPTTIWGGNAGNCVSIQAVSSCGTAGSTTVPASCPCPTRPM